MDELFKIFGEVVGAAIEGSEEAGESREQMELPPVYERYLCGRKRELGVNDR